MNNVVQCNGSDDGTQQEKFNIVVCTGSSFINHSGLLKKKHIASHSDGNCRTEL